MKINELLGEFRIQLSNEEAEVLEKIDRLTPLAQFNERDTFIIENLIRKSLVSRVVQHNCTMVIRNEEFW